MEQDRKEKDPKLGDSWGTAKERKTLHEEVFVDGVVAKSTMVRPRLRRRVRFRARSTYFKPAGVPLRSLEEIGVTRDELEALRLKDVEKLDQRDAAERMEVSQPTFHRILQSARNKTAEALIKGKAIRIIEQ